MRYEQDVAQRATVLRHLARSLSASIAVFEKQVGVPLRTFPEYKKARAQYLELQALIFTIGDKAAEGKGRGAPQDLKPWLVRMRLRAIAAFTRISLQFFRDPPDLLVQALGAFEILQMEQEAFRSVLNDFDMMLMESAVDDKTSMELDQVRTDMEEILRWLDLLLQTAPPPLTTFEG